ncbi:GAP family protein [Mycobacterium sp.]|jgi:cytochrome c biogenesis protein CcdA|uniref:GAP family protein n=1 Tax=Mycobacterium sp. TaxID=1785 RepID=UPI002D483F18|nr:GAP family protein [Mycobacterium sp.]HZA08582.1 GAP family protein [Mycobacterium sp.]
MVALLLAFTGFAILDSLNVLNVGVTTAVVYDSRLSRRSPLPGGLSFVAGVFAVTTTFGVCTILGIKVLARLAHFEVTPTIRYWAELAVGLVLIALACLPMAAQSASPAWAATIMRRRPWLLGFVGMAIGLGQAPTAVPYLTALAMLSAHNPLPRAWPLIVIAYCAIALLPPLLVLALATRQTTRARRLQRSIVRVLARFGPTTVRTLFLVIGLVLVADAFLHQRDLL